MARSPKPPHRLSTYTKHITSAATHIPRHMFRVDGYEVVQHHCNHGERAEGVGKVVQCDVWDHWERVLLDPLFLNIWAVKFIARRKSIGYDVFFDEAGELRWTRFRGSSSGGLCAYPNLVNA